jgi:hypothetical protein
VVAKIVTETTLFCLSYVVQRLVVFSRRLRSKRVLHQERIKVTSPPVQIPPRAATAAGRRHLVES